MPNTLNGRTATQIPADEQHSKNITSQNDWSDVSKELLDSLPQVWTRGLLYFLVVFVSIILPWAMFFKVDETGVARGRIEPEGKTFKVDAAVPGTVAEIHVKEGESVKKGQTLLVLESELVKADLRQAKDKLEGQLNRLSKLNLLKNQFTLTLTTQRQQNQAQALEKQAQVNQARQNINALKNSYNLQKEEKQAQVNQARKSIEHSQTNSKLDERSLASAVHEIQRYRQLRKEGMVAEINVVQREDIAQERRKSYEQSKSDIEQGKLHLAEQQSSYERTLRQSKADIAQADLKLKEQEISYQTLTHSGKLAILKIEEQVKNTDTDITTLKSEIAQSNSQIQSLAFQLGQRVLKATVNGTVFQLPIQKAGSVVQPGTLVAEIAPENVPFIIRAQMATTESGSLRKGLPVKLKFDAYPFQEYGVLEGKLSEISPTTSEMDTPSGKVAAYNLDIVINQHCIPSGNKCIPLRPGDTATAEVIVRQRRIIDFLLDPFKKLQQGG
uniref:Secretion protein HlyD family protein n=1 Tax=Stigonema sp. PCC 9446 TaxID=2099385 RepID=A0A2P0ZGF0_9CYAN|nr:secretion protein HlyD family protein [Stigonema sp. PCC 9446]